MKTTETWSSTVSINITTAFNLRHPSFIWTRTDILSLLNRVIMSNLEQYLVIVSFCCWRKLKLWSSCSPICIWVARIIIISLHVSLVYSQQMCGNWFCITPNHLLFIHSSFVLFSMNWTRSEWMFGLFYHLPVVQTNEGYESFLLSFIFQGTTAFNHMLLWVLCIYLCTLNIHSVHLYLKSWISRTKSEQKGTEANKIFISSIKELVE